MINVDCVVDNEIKLIKNFKFDNYNQAIKDVQTLLGVDPAPKIESAAKFILAKSAIHNNMAKLAEKTLQENPWQ